MTRYEPLYQDDDAVDLRQFDEAYASTIPPAPDEPAAEIPDGFYETIIEDVTLSRTPRSGNPMVSWRLHIQGPTHSGRRIHKKSIITERTLTFLKEDLGRCGIELERLSDLSARLAEMRGIEMRVMKRTREGWTNVYFLRKRQESEQLDDNLPF